MIENSAEVLDNIPFNLDAAALLSELRVSPGSQDAKDIGDLVRDAKTLARAKAIYKVCYIETNDGQTVRIDGVAFKSRVLSANLREVQRAFPYIATCGTELEQLDIPCDDLARSYWADSLKGMILRASLDYLYRYIEDKFALKQTSMMSPGSAEPHIWPIEQQRQLFSLFPNAQAAIGVTLTDTCLMVPSKSVSGILFPTEIDFRSCQLCRRKNCPLRAAPFDPHLMESYDRSADR
ncbi:MAG: vitamin B12 dependent-methionine synthase activation domain-containing protein [Planctomycetota bacterium]|jgi:hypothetical protein